MQGWHRMSKWDHSDLTISDRWQQPSLKCVSLQPATFLILLLAFWYVNSFLPNITTHSITRLYSDHLLGPAAGALLMTAARVRPASQSRSRSLRAWAWLRWTEWTRINTSNSRLSLGITMNDLITRCLLLCDGGLWFPHLLICRIPVRDKYRWLRMDLL